MAAYATAWGSGDWAQVESLYQPGVVRRDTVFRSDTDGLEQLRTTAEKTFDSRPDTTWTTLLAFGTGLSRGAIFSVDDPQCSVVVAVLIELENDKIAREEIYYDVGSLLACEWLE